MTFVSTDIDHYTHEQLKQAYYDLAFRYEEIAGDNHDALNIQSALGLTRQEAMFVCMLMDGMVKSHNAIVAAVSFKSIADIALQNEIPSVTKVIACKARKAMKRHGIEIKTVWGVGYQMMPDQIAKLKTLINLPNHKLQAVREG